MRALFLGVLPAFFLIGGLTVGSGVMGTLQRAIVRVDSAAGLAPLMLLGVIVAAQVGWAAFLVNR